jgi:hypothetical protein
VDQKEVMKALSQLQGNAGLVSALQQKLDGLVGMSSGFVEGLHYKVRARVEELGGAVQVEIQLDPELDMLAVRLVQLASRLGAIAPVCPSLSKAPPGFNP